MIYTITVLSDISSDKKEVNGSYEDKPLYERHYLEVEADEDNEARERGTIAFKQEHETLDIVWLIVSPKKDADYSYEIYS